MKKYINLRDKPELKNAAAAWFHSKWDVPEQAYLDCMTAYLNRETEYGWYLCLNGDRIIGGMGVIENDFHDRKDLTPNVCAVYTEEAFRGQGIAGQQYAEKGEIEASLQAEITSPMIPEDQYAAIVNSGV